jgi:cytochrome c oxidase cbb3-type subunit 2
MRHVRLGALSALAATVVGASFFLFRGAAPAQETTSAAPSLTAADWPLSPAEARGRVVYENYCVGCHGDEGRGDGPASRFLDPVPRDFQAGKFKFRSTPFGQPPFASDLMRTVTCGLPGSSMPGFPLVPEIERKDVVSYVLHLAKFGAAVRSLAYAVREDGSTIDQFRKDRLPALRDEIDAEWASIKRATIAPEPPADAASVERGHALFATTCASCHGARGVGDGASSYALRDDRSAVIRPRDFTTGVFRSGSTPEDVFIRVKTGLSGTPMPAFANYPDEQIWDLVHFILSLKDPLAEKPKMPPGCGHEGGAR